MSSLAIESRRRMNSGYEIPVLGYGVYQTPHEICEDVVSFALEVGYRHVDSAAAYRNERFCGLALAKSKVPREQVFFTSKIPPKDLSYQKTKTQVDQTLRETGLGYIDLMLIHSPYGGSENRKGAWRALVEAQEIGKIRSLGVSNYGIHHLEELDSHMKELEQERGMGGGGVLSVVQVELHPWLPRPDIVQWCQRRGIVLEAYSPLVRGERLDDDAIKSLKEKHGKTSAQILLRWSLQRGFVPLPKSVTSNRIVENTNLFDFELAEEDMEALDTSDYKPCAWDPTVAPLES